MRQFIAVCLLLALTLLGDITFAGTTKASDRKAQEGIRKILEDQVAAWNRGDIDGFMQGYWNSPDLTFTSGGAVRRGWQTTLERYRISYPNRETMGALSFSDLEIHVLSSSAAWILGKWQLKRAKDEPHGIFTLMLQKFPMATYPSRGVWRIVHDHTSASQ
jgi:ketosteroid isomerase-like protein